MVVVDFFVESACADAAIMISMPTLASIIFFTPSLFNFYADYLRNKILSISTYPIQCSRPVHLFFLCQIDLPMVFQRFVLLRL